MLFYQRHECKIASTSRSIFWKKYPSIIDITYVYNRWKYSITYIWYILCATVCIIHICHILLLYLSYTTTHIRSDSDPIPPRHSHTQQPHLHVASFGRSQRETPERTSPNTMYPAPVFWYLLGMMLFESASQTGECLKKMFVKENSYSLVLSHCYGKWMTKWPKNITWFAHRSAFSMAILNYGSINRVHKMRIHPSIPNKCNPADFFWRDCWRSSIEDWICECNLIVSGPN